jgi:hypothetical protein
MATVVATKNYGLFELCDFNRDVKKTRNLMASMKRDGWIDAYPMHVVRNGNKKLKIKGGHHRFEVAQQLGIAVKYVVCDDEATVHQLERSTNPWKMDDYFNSFCRQGRQNYLAVKKYMDRTGIRLSQAVSMLSGGTAASGNHNEAFKDGNFTLSSDQSHAEAVGAIVVACRERSIPCATSRDFVHAISRMLYVEDFDAQTFIRRAAVNPSLLTKQVGVDAYSEMIEYVYNYKSSHKVALAFPSKQLAKDRSMFVAKN